MRVSNNTSGDSKTGKAWSLTDGEGIWITQPELILLLHTGLESRRFITLKIVPLAKNKKVCTYCIYRRSGAASLVVNLWLVTQKRTSVLHLTVSEIRLEMDL